MDPNATLKQICEHLCHKGGDYEECLELIEALIDWLSHDGFEPNDDHNFHWSDVVVGAYWFLSHYHGGEKSPEYRVLCKCGQIFRPGRTTGVEEDSSEKMCTSVSKLSIRRITRKKCGKWNESTLDVTRPLGEFAPPL